MNRYMKTVVALTVAGVLAGCGSATSNNTDGSASSNTTTTVTNKSNTTFFVFFRNLFASGVELELAPNPNDVSVSASKKIIVYLPLYPGSTPTKSVTTFASFIPSRPNSVIGTVFYESKDSETQIKKWYTNELHQLGYTVPEYGVYKDHGKTICTFSDFAADGQPIGFSTKLPSIKLTFLTQKQGNETVFALSALLVLT